MPPHDIVVIGASSGGVEAIVRVASAFPPDFPAAVFVVLHVSPLSPSVLPQILSWSSRIPATHPADGETIKPGHIYFAPPDRHLLVTPDHIEVTAGPRENHHRPSIDVLFHSAAEAFGPRVIGVILTGALDDGAAGLWAVRNRGGLTFVQDPNDAVYPSMPLAAIGVAAPHHILELDAIGPKLVEVVAQRQREPAPAARAAPDSEVTMQPKGAGDIDEQTATQGMQLLLYEEKVRETEAGATVLKDLFNRRKKALP